MACNRAAILEWMPSFALLKNQSRRKSGVNKTAHRQAAELSNIVQLPRIIHDPLQTTATSPQLVNLGPWCADLDAIVLVTT